MGEAADAADGAAEVLAQEAGASQDLDKDKDADTPVGEGGMAMKEFVCALGAPRRIPWSSTRVPSQISLPCCSASALICALTRFAPHFGTVRLAWSGLGKYRGLGERLTVLLEQLVCRMLLELANGRSASSCRSASSARETCPVQYSRDRLPARAAKFTGLPVARCAARHVRPGGGQARAAALQGRARLLGQGPQGHLRLVRGRRHGRRRAGASTPPPSLTRLLPRTLLPPAPPSA